MFNRFESRVYRTPVACVAWVQQGSRVSGLSIIARAGENAGLRIRFNAYDRWLRATLRGMYSHASLAHTGLELQE